MSVLNEAPAKLSLDDLLQLLKTELRTQLVKSSMQYNCTIT